MLILQRICYGGGGKKGEIKYVRKAIERGTSIEQKNCGLTPLARAAIDNHVEIAKFLLEKGANLNTSTKDKLVFIRMAKLERNPQTFKGVWG